MTNAVVRTGKGSIYVENVELVTNGEYTINVYGKAPAELFSAIYITDTTEAMAFLSNYVARRHLTAARNIPGYDLALINPRHDSIRNITIDTEGLNLLEFIEPEFITLVTGDDN